MPKQNVYHTIDFGITAADGLEASSSRIGCEITGEALERITLGLQKITNHEG